MRSKIFTRTVGYWSLQEASGKALDYSGNENHASTTNVSSYGASGPVGSNAMDFDGSDDYISLTGWERPTDSYTYAVWFKPSSSIGSGDGRYDFIYGGGGGSTVRPHISFDNGGNGYITHFYKESNGSNGSVSTTTSSFGAEWHLIVVTYQSGESAKIFYNGVEEGSSSVSTNADDSDGLTIGANDSNSNNFDGKIAHVRVWDYPLSEASIKALYNASEGGFSESDRRGL